MIEEVWGWDCVVLCWGIALVCEFCFSLSVFT